MRAVTLALLLASCGGETSSYPRDAAPDAGVCPPDYAPWYAGLCARAAPESDCPPSNHTWWRGLCIVTSER